MIKKEMSFYKGKLVDTMSKEELEASLLEIIKLSLAQGKKLGTTFVGKLNCCHEDEI